MLAVISGEALVHALVWILVAGVIFGVVVWLIGYCELTPPFAKAARIVAAIIAVIVVINALLMVVGHPFISW